MLLDMVVPLDEPCAEPETVKSKRDKPRNILENRADALVAVKSNGSELEHVSSKLQDDAEIVTTAMDQAGGVVFRYASERLRADPEFVLKCIRPGDANALLHTALQLEHERDLLLAAIAIERRALRFVPATWWTDRSFVLAAVKIDGPGALKRAVEEFQDDRAVVKAAVKQSPSALKYASDDVCADPAIVRFGGPASLRYASPELRANPEFVLDLTRAHIASVANGDAVAGGCALQWASRDVRTDVGVVLEVIKNDPDAIQYAEGELWNNHEFVCAAVAHDPRLLCYASETLRADRRVQLAAMKSLEYGSSGQGFAKLAIINQITSPPKRTSIAQSMWPKALTGCSNDKSSCCSFSCVLLPPAPA